MNVPQYETCKVALDGQVATVTLTPPRQLKAGTSDLHWDLGELFSWLRGENSVRVVVLTGSQGEFYVPPSDRSFYRSEAAKEYLVEPTGAWKTFTGIVRVHQALAEIEKPILAKVNGHAIGFGSSLVFASDLIIAADDALIVDTHLSMGEFEDSGPEFGIVPGDGGGPLVPLFLTPAKAKEYLMLGKPYTGRELARDGVINYSVPSNELDALADQLVERLLKRSAFALAWTKRIVNRRVADSLNMSLDAGAAYEMVNFLQLEHLDGKDPKGLQ